MEVKKLYSHFKAVFVVLALVNCVPLHAQSGIIEDLKISIERLENELLYSNELALKTTTNILNRAGLVPSDEAKAISRLVKAIKFLKIEKQKDSANFYTNRALTLYKELKDSTMLFKSLHMRYDYHDMVANNDSLFLYATKEIQIANRLDNSELKVIAYIDMGDVYYLTKQHDKVFSYRKKALKIASKHNLKKYLADIHIKIAQSHLRLSRQRTQKALDSAIFHGQRALKHARDINYNYGIYESTVRLADFLNVNKQHEEALQLIESVIYLPKQNIPIRFNYTAPFYYAVILKDNGEYAKAKDIVRDLITQIDSTEYDKKLGTNYFLSVLYAYNNQPDSTDYAIKQAVIANNALAEGRTNERISELQTKYETDLKEREIKNLEQQTRLEQLEIQELQRQRFMLLLASIIPVTLLIAGGWYANRRRLKLQLEKEQQEYAKQMSELKALRSQMNPHFIFNAMNSIQEYIFTNEKKLASSYLVKFSRLIRIYLEQSQQSEITLEKEIQALELYLQLENNRFDEQLNYVINVDNNLDLLSILVPSLFIQPYVENAIKHGLLHKMGKKELTIDFKFNNSKNQLEVTIQDNGIGREASRKHNENRPYKSFSTEASLDRVKLINIKSDNKLSVKIIDLKDKNNRARGTKVKIIISVNGII